MTASPAKKRKALITGAASGLGAALSRECLAGEYDVVAVDQDLSGLELLGDTVVPIVADLAITASLDALAARLVALGPYDCIVMNAGINATGPFESVPLDLQHRVIGVNLTAPMVLTAAFIAADALRPGGAIVFVSSLSHFVGYPGAASYAASKDGLASYARSLRRPLRRRRNRVVIAYPGPMDTPHAARHAPPGSRHRQRMPPEIVARSILRATARGGAVVPGLTSKFAALIGRFMPGATTSIMRRAMFERLERRN